MADYCRNDFRSWIFFIVGLIAAISMRVIEPLNIFNNSYGKIAWYIGVSGFFIFFLYKYVVDKRKAELLKKEGLIQKAKKHLKKWDSIVGHHSHVPGPVCLYCIEGNEKLVAYSLGDSSTGLRNRRYRHGVAMKLCVGKRNDQECTSLISGSWRYTELIKTEKHAYTLTVKENCDL